MNQKIKVHFVCSGNIFRSRLAEAYAKSLGLGQLEISSSGVFAAKYPPDFLSPWAKIAGHQNKFSEWFSPTRNQTSSAQLQSSDIIVFMSEDVLLAAKQNYDFNQSICVVWAIKDRGDWRKKLPIGQKRRRTIKHIKSRVDQLIIDITRGGWVDVVDEANKPLNFKLPIAIANQNKLWHRSCHAIITTPNKSTLVEKRSNHIIFSPNRIDVTLGGHVDAGETPGAAILREIFEETGLRVDPSLPRLLEVYKWNSYHPRYKRYSKTFQSTYHVLLPSNNPVTTIQPAEVASMSILSPRQLRHLITFHRIKNLGQLSYNHAYYLRIAKMAGVFADK